MTEYQGHLERAYGNEAVDRLENIEELKAYATVVANENPDGTAEVVASDDGEDEEMEQVEIGAPANEEIDVPDEEVEPIVMPFVLPHIARGDIDSSYSRADQARKRQKQPRVRCGLSSPFRCLRPIPRPRNRKLMHLLA